MRLVRGLVATAVVIAFLAAGGLFADGYVRRISEQRIADSLQKQLALPAAPTVTLGGWPFALSLLTRRIPEATATAPVAPMTISGHRVNLTELRVDGRDLTVGDSEVVIGTLVADARLGYADLSTLAATQVGYADNGRLSASYATAVLGRQLSVAVSAEPVVDEASQTVNLEDAEITVAGVTLTPELSQSLLDQVVKPINVRLDFGLRLLSVEATADGLELHATATDFRSPLA